MRAVRLGQLSFPLSGPPVPVLSAGVTAAGAEHSVPVDHLAVLCLARSRKVGAATYHRLIHDHGNARAALDALPDIARAAGLNDYRACPAAVAKAELAAGQRVGARLLVYGQPEYPTALIGLTDAPPVLWALGDLSLLDRPALAMVGARQASSLALRMARHLARDLSEAGFAIVSGLARGVDAVAHDAAMGDMSKGGTIGIQAGGIDVISPMETKTLHDTMAQKGLRLAELPPGQAPQPYHFPQRNRIIAGLCQATIVVEAAAQSGSLLTAQFALDYGREVMAVPGHPLDQRTAGGNRLLRDGAVLIRNAQDVIATIGSAGGSVGRPIADTPQLPTSAVAAPAPTPMPVPAHDSQARILAVLDTAGVVSEDALITTLNLPAAQVIRDIAMLELDGQVLRRTGGLLQRILD